MRCPEAYLDEVTETQGELFKLAVERDYDLAFFISSYLKSAIRNFIDKGYAIYCTMSATDILEALQNTQMLKNSETFQNDDMATWIGEFYSLKQWKTGIPSSKLVTLIQPKDLISKYNVLHDMDINLAVDRYKIYDETYSMVFFHNPDEENGYLSNWYLSEFYYNGVKYSSMEQYMMHQKATLFNDEVIAKEILQTDDVARIKSLGRQVSNFVEGVWITNRENIVFEGLLCKFSQNKDLESKLLSTENQVIAECAVRDRIWGIGLSMRDENRFHQEKWEGQNLLGKQLMRAREHLKETVTTTNLF
jgi:hypothetical protein